jgi:hypothetical protein
MAFVVCGLVAGAISFAIFDSAPEPDPMNAMALAPPDALAARKLVSPAARSEKPLANAPSVQKIGGEGADQSRKAGPLKPTCREGSGEVRQGDCPVRVTRLRPPRAVNEQPAIAAVPIGHRDDPTMIPAPPQTLAGPLPADPPAEPKANLPPTQLSVAEETAAGAAPAAEPAPPVPVPAVASKKSRPRVHHASRRHEQYSYSSSSSAGSSRYGGSRTYVQAGYARLW